MPDNPFSLQPTAPEGLSRLFGAPTYEQAGARSEAETMKALSDLHSKNGGNPQQAVVDFLKSPKGMEHVTNMGMRHGGGAETTGVLQKWIQSVTPPQQALSPGQSLVSGTGPNAKVTASNPTAEVQNRSDLTRLLTSDDPRISQSAAAALYGGGDPGVKAQAADELARSGIIKPDVAQKLKAGVYVQAPVLNLDGETIGQQIIDKTSGQVVASSVGTHPQQPQATTPGATPSPGTPGQPTPGPQTSAQPQQQDGDNALLADPKRSLALGFGPLATARAGVGQATRAFIDPAYTDPKSELVKQRRMNEDILRTDVTQLAEASPRVKAALQSYFRLLPSEEFTDPVTAAQRLDRLRDMGEEGLRGAQSVLKEGIVLHSRKAVREAEGEAKAYTKLLGDLPSREDNASVTRMVRGGTAGAETPGSVAGATAKGALQVIPGVGAAAKGAQEALSQPGNQPGGPKTPQGSAADVGKMDANQLRAYARGLNEFTTAPAVLRAVEARARELSGGKK